MNRLINTCVKLRKNLKINNRNYQMEVRLINRNLDEYMYIHVRYTQIDVQKDRSIDLQID